MAFPDAKALYTLLTHRFVLISLVVTVLVEVPSISGNATDWSTRLGGGSQTRILSCLGATMRLACVLTFLVEMHTTEPNYSFGYAMATTVKTGVGTMARSSTVKIPGIASTFL